MEGRWKTGKKYITWDYASIPNKKAIRAYRKMQRAPQSAQDSVEGPALVLVVICSWQLKHVKVTGPSDNSVGTTNWVATAGGALCVGPMAEK